MALTLAAGQVLTATDLNNRIPKYVMKAVDTTKTSSSTFADDPELQLSLAAGIYKVEAGLQIDGNSGNLKVQWLTTGTITLVGSRICHGISEKNNDPNGQAAVGAGDPIRACATTSFTATFSPTNSVVGYGTDAGGTTGVHENMIVSCTVAGLLKLSWAQFTSNADVTTMRTGSWLMATRLA